MKYFKLNSDLSIKKLPNYVRMFTTSVVLNVVLIALLSYSFAYPEIKEVHHVKVVNKEVPEDIKLSDSAILNELVKNNCILPSVALAQTKVETGHYTSQVCKENKNLFGIKYHKCKYVKGNHLNHASYETYKDNIKCYIHVQNRYLTNIDGKYAESPNYLKALKQIK